MNTIISMTDDEEYDYMNYLREKYGDAKARDFYKRARELQHATTSQSKANGGNGIPWVAKGVTNESVWKHDGYKVVVRVTDENSEKGGVTFEYVQGDKDYSPEMIEKFKKIHSFSGFGKIIDNSNAALEHGSWRCIKEGHSTTRASKGYVAKVGDTLRRTYKMNGYKAS